MTVLSLGGLWLRSKNQIATSVWASPLYLDPENSLNQRNINNSTNIFTANPTRSPTAKVASVASASSGSISPEYTIDWPTEFTTDAMAPTMSSHFQSMMRPPLAVMSRPEAFISPNATYADRAPTVTDWRITGSVTARTSFDVNKRFERYEPVNSGIIALQPIIHVASTRTPWGK